MTYFWKRGLFVLLFVLFCTPVMAAGDVDVVKLIAKILNSAIFFGGLYYLLRKPIGNFFRNRREKIEADLAMAEKSREEARQRLDEIEQKMANLDKELAEIEEQARAEADREKERLHLEAEKDAARIREQAKTDIENMRRESQQKLKVFMADLAVAEAERMLKTSMTDEDRKRIFNDFTERLGAKS